MSFKRKRIKIIMRKALAVISCFAFLSMIMLPAWAVDTAPGAIPEEHALAVVPAGTPALEHEEVEILTSPSASSAVIPAGTTVLVNSETLDLSSLNVAQGSNLILDFSNSANFSLSGNLANSGNIYAISTNPGVTGVNISANNVYNNTAALITTVIPQNGIAGFSIDIGSLVPNLSLSIAAIQNIVNAGTISSAANLSLTAGNTITNALPQAVAGPSPVLAAMQNVNLQATNIINSGQIAANLASINAFTANLSNSMGLMQALNGSLNIQNLTGNTLSVNNIMGQMTAGKSIAMEAIKNSLDNSSKTLLTVVGGNLDAPDLSFKASGGKIIVDTSTLSGAVALAAGDASVHVEQGNLNIASSALTGDPIFSSPGTVNLSGLFTTDSTFFTRGADLIVLAGEDIIAPGAPDDALISAGASSGPGGEIRFASGVDYSVSNPACFMCESGVDYHIYGASKTGGDIDLPSVSLITADNDISLQANAGKSSRGNIYIGDISICTDCQGRNHEQPGPAISSLSFNESSNSCCKGSGQISLIASGNIVAANLLNIPGGIFMKSHHGKIEPVSGSSIQAFGGDVSMYGNADLNKILVNAVNGNINAAGGSLKIEKSSLNAFASKFGNGGNLNLYYNYFDSCGYNDFIASGGDISISGKRSLKTGKFDNFLACSGGNCGHSKNSGGDITLKSSYGSVEIGYANEMNAVGGSINVNARKNVNIGNWFVANAFSDGAKNPGNIEIESEKASVCLGDFGKYNAVGGDIELDAGYNLKTGSFNKFLTCSGGNCGPKTGGDIKLSTNYGKLVIGYKNELLANGGSIYVNSNRGDVWVSDHVKMSSFNNGETDSADIFISANKGSVNLKDNGKYQAVGGDIAVTALKDIHSGKYNEFNAYSLYQLADKSKDGKHSNSKSKDDSKSWQYSQNWNFDEQFNKFSNNFNNKNGKNSNKSKTVYKQSDGGDISFLAGGDICLGPANNFNAAGGDILIAAGKKLSTGAYNNFLACAGGDCGQHHDNSGGSITLTAISGPICIDKKNEMHANGGSLAIFSFGDLKIGDDFEGNAFAGKSKNSGDLYITSLFADVDLGNNGKYNAVGGDLSIYAGDDLSTGYKNEFSAFAQTQHKSKSSTGGDLKISAGDDISFGSFNKFNAVGGDIEIEARDNLKTGYKNEFLACASGDCGRSGNGGDIKLVADYGKVTIANNNRMDAVGGDLSIKSYHDDVVVGDDFMGNAFSNGHEASDITLKAYSGNVKLGDNGSYNAVGGDIEIEAGKDIETGCQNIFNAYGQSSYKHSFGGNIELDACENICLGPSNTFNAGAGDIGIYAGKKLSTGSYNKFLACSGPNCGYGNHKFNSDSGGNISLKSHDELKIGKYNEMTAIGGSIAIKSECDSIHIDKDFTAAAYKDGKKDAGNISVNAKDGDLTVGSRANFTAVGGDICFDAHDSILTGDKSSFQAFAQSSHKHISGGDIKWNAGHDICIGDWNNLTAVGGDINLYANKKLHTGYGDEFLACAAGNCGHKGDKGGDIILTANYEEAKIGDYNTMNANGGSIQIRSKRDDVLVGDCLQANAFSDGSKDSGNITLISDRDDVHMGSGNQLNAVGGNICIEADDDITMRDYNELNAFVRWSRKGASGGNVKLSADGDIDIDHHNQFNAVGGNLDLIACGFIDIGKENKFSAFNSKEYCDYSSGGNINLDAGDDIKIARDNKFRAVSGDIRLNSEDGKIWSDSGNHFCTFNYGDIKFESSKDMSLSGNSIDADGSVKLESHKELDLEHNKIIARKGDLKLYSGNNEDILLNSNDLMAKYDIWIISNDDIRSDHKFLSGNNKICSLYGDIKLDACDEIKLGLADKIEAANGEVLVKAGNNIKLGELGIFAAGKGDLSFIAEHGGIDMGLANTFNAFGYYKNGQYKGGNVNVRAEKGIVFLGFINSFNAVGGKIDIEGKFIIPGALNRYCTYNKYGHEDNYPKLYANNRYYGYDYKCQDCDKPSRPTCELPDKLCRVPQAPKAPVAADCPDTPETPVCYLPPPPTPPECPEPPEAKNCKLPPPPPDFCPEAPRPPLCPKPPEKPECELPPIPPLPPAQQTALSPAPAETPVAPPAAPQQITVEIPSIFSFPVDYIWTITDKEENYFEKICNSPAKRTALLSNGLSLKGGQSVVEGGENGETVTLPQTIVKIPPHGTAVIQNAEADQIGVISMTDKETGNVTVLVENQGEYALQPGEQLIVTYQAEDGPDGLSDPDNEIAESDPQVMKVVTLMPQDVPYQIIWGTTRHNFTYWLPTNKYPGVGGALSKEEVLSHLGEAPSSELPDNEQVSGKDLRPIAFKQSTNLRLDDKKIKTNKKTRIRQLASNVYRLSAGQAIFFKDKDLSVLTPHGRIILDSDAVVSITVKRNVTLVRDLYDNMNDDVIVLVNKTSHKLGPGQECAIVSAPKNQARNIVYSDRVGRRDLRAYPVGDDKHIVLSDVSHVNLFIMDDMLRSLRNSKNHEDRVLYNKLEKMAAVISSVRDRTRGPFTIPYEASSQRSIAASRTGPGM